MSLVIPTLTKQGQISGSGFTHDTWDTDTYSSVVIDEGGSYRMFYTGYDGLAGGRPCMATSTDLVTWTKPNLGQETYDGNTNNNIIIYHEFVEMSDVIVADGQYVGLFFNTNSDRALLYTSPDGITWTYVQNIFTAVTHGEYAECKCMLFDGTTYKCYYVSGHTAQRRSIGYYSATSLAGTWTDQGLLSDFTSTDQDVQYYDLYTWQYAGSWYGCVPPYNKTTDILGPLKQYRSDDDGLTWALVDTLLEMGADGAFDDGLLAAAKPILVNHHWYMMYAGSDDTHDVSPRTTLFGVATGRENTSMSLTFHAPFYQTKSLAPVIGPTGTCTRSGNAGYFDSSGVWQYAATNTAAFDHDPATGESLGLSIWDTYTNLVPSPEDFSTGWTAAGATVDTDVGVFIDGNTTMDRLNVGTGTEVHRIYDQMTMAGATSAYMECEYQDDGARYVSLSWLGTTNDWCTVIADLQLGTITQESEGATTGTITESGIDDLGGGNYRIWMIATVTTANPFIVAQTHFTATPSLNTSGGQVFTGVAGNDVFLGGAFAVASTVKLPYAPTTHNADQMHWSDVSWYNATAGTLYMKILPSDITSDRFIIAIVPGTSSADGLSVWFDTPEGTISAFHGTTTGNDGLIQMAGVAIANTPIEIAIAYANNDMVMYVNGVAGTPDSTITAPPTNAPDNMKVGRAALGDLFLHGQMQDIRYDNTRLTDKIVQEWSQGIFAGLDLNHHRNVSRDVTRGVTRDLVAN